MPFYLYEELLDSREITRDATGTTEVRVYKVYSDNPTSILTSNAIPYHGEPHPTLPLMYVSRVDITPPTDDGSTCRMRVTYKEWPLSMTIYAENWEWDISSQQVNIRSVRDPSYALHLPATHDVGVVIGYNGDTVEGVDVYRPSVSLKVTKIWQGISQYDRELLEVMTNTVNGSYWFGYNAGEVLFLGANIQRTTEGMIQVTYNFLISRYVGPQSVLLADGSYVVLDQVKPFDYVWYRYTETAGSAGTETVMQKGIESVHVAQVYDWTDFHLLNLTGPYG